MSKKKEKVKAVTPAEALAEAFKLDKTKAEPEPD